MSHSKLVFLSLYKALYDMSRVAVMELASDISYLSVSCLWSSCIDRVYSLHS